MDHDSNSSGHTKIQDATPRLPRDAANEQVEIELENIGDALPFIANAGGLQAAGLKLP